MAMEVDYIHEYEYDEEETLPSIGGSQENSELLNYTNKPRTKDSDDAQHLISTAHTQLPPYQPQDPSSQPPPPSGGEGVRIFIRSPYFDTYALGENGKGDDFELRERKEARHARCNCEAQARYGGPQHHHHPIQPVTLQFSIVMGHV
jgi:hypothetical protein